MKKADPIKAAKMKGPAGYNLDVTSDARRLTKAEREAARAEAKAAAKAAKEEGKKKC